MKTAWLQSRNVLPDLITGKLDAKLVDAVLEQIRVGPGQGGAHLLEQAQKAQDLHLVLGPTRVDEVADFLQASKRTVFRLIASGKLRAFKLNKVGYRIRTEDLETFIEKKIAEIDFS